MPSSSLTASLTFTPPLGGSACTVQFSGTENYVPQNVGTMDIPIGTPSATAIPVPFGEVDSADVLVVKNRGNQDLGVRLNGLPVSPAVLYQIPPGGELILFNPVAPGGSPLTSAELETTTTQAGVVGEVDYWVFGAA